MTKSKVVVILLFALLFSPDEGGAQSNSAQTITKTQQAAFGWTWASSAVNECGTQITWNTASGKPIRPSQAQKLFTSEGHKRKDVLAAMNTRKMGSYPFIQLDQWFIQSGFKPTAQNANKLLCDLAAKVAGTNHPMGRFLKRQ